MTKNKHFVFQFNLEQLQWLIHSYVEFLVKENQMMMMISFDQE
jgi:hypothetical protein